jgi:hypothetical protein
MTHSQLDKIDRRAEALCSEVFRCVPFARHPAILVILDAIKTHCRLASQGGRWM